MRIGLIIFPTDTTIQPVELAVAAEERGFESLWFPEHSHIPAARTTPWGGREGAPPLPEHYWRTHDQFVALAAAAAATTTLQLGTGITLVAQRDALWLAKEVASLDVISGGRFHFGVGYGWNREEMRQHGVRYTERRAILREKVLAMKELWTNDEASFQGEHVSLEASWAWPKPVQQPHPAILLGGSPGPRTFGDIAEFCDGWMPFDGRYDLASNVAELRRRFEATGRDPATLQVSIFGARPTRERFAELAALGADRAILVLPQGSAAEVLAKLDEYAALL